MSKTTKIEPNLQFVKELQEVGGVDLKLELLARRIWVRLWLL